MAVHATQATLYSLYLFVRDVVFFPLARLSVASTLRAGYGQLRLEGRRFHFVRAKGRGVFPCRNPARLPVFGLLRVTSMSAYQTEKIT